MNKSFFASINQVQEIINYYWEFREETTNNSFLFKAKVNECSIIIYTNNHVLFQGNNALNEYNKWVQNDFVEHIGSDEVGCGDYFAPIVVCCSLVTKENEDFLIDLGVKDSKMLTDEKILEITPKIMNKIPYASFTLSNEKYNQLYQKYHFNLNSIKAYLHNFVISKLVKKYHYQGLIVIDQFAKEELYYHYLKTFTNDIVTNIHFECKAENKYLAVACGSIIARFIFLNEVNKLKEKLKMTIPLGASSKVDEIVLECVKKHGENFLNKYVKLNFANTKKILEQL